MLFPVTNRNLVLVGKECGIASKSWFWHFTVWEEHRHLSGQPWQDSETTRRKNKCIIADLRAPPRVSPRSHPHDVLNRRILDRTNLSARTVRKDSLTITKLSYRPCSSTRNETKFCNYVSHVCFFLTSNLASI